MKNIKKILILIALIIFSVIAVFFTKEIFADIERVPTDSLLPIASIDGGRSSLLNQNNIFEFKYAKGSRSVSYLFDPSNQINRNGYLAINVKMNGQEFQPPFNAAPLYRLVNKEVVTLSDNRIQSSLISAEKKNNSLILTYRDNFPDGSSKDRTSRLSLRGGSLQLVVSSVSTSPEVDANYNYAGFDLGGNSSNGLRKISIPYAPLAPVAILNNNLFSTAFFDLTKSASTGLYSVDQKLFSYPLGYNMTGPNKVSKLQETAYLTASERLDDVLPLPDNPVLNGNQDKIKRMFLLENTLPSRATPDDQTLYNDDSESEGVVEYCSGTPTEESNDNPAAPMPFEIGGQKFNQYTFNNTSVYLEILAKLGVKDIVYGSLKFKGDDSPKTLPVCSRWGGDEMYKKIFETASLNGQTHIDHQVWHRISGKFLDQSSPDFNPTYLNATAKTRDGDPKPYSQFTPNSYASSSESLRTISEPVINTLKTRYNLSGTFLDSLTGWIPNRINKLNFDQNSNSKTLSGAITNMKDYFRFLNQTLPGPIIGEGGKGPERYDSYYAGYIDGVERENDGQKNGLIIPDYELKVVLPKSPLQVGMGWQNRWQCQNGQGAEDNLEFGGTTQSDQVICNEGGMSKFNRFDFDRYRAQVLSFGHAHLLPMSMNLSPKNSSNLNTLLSQITKEYYLVDEIQKQYLYQKIKKINYYDESGSNLGDLSSVLKKKPSYNFRSSRIRLEYESGLVIYINNADSSSITNWSVSFDRQTFILPPNGFVAYNPHIEGWQKKGKFLAFSSLINGKRLDYVSSENYLFMDSGNETISYNKRTAKNLRVYTRKIKIVCDTNCKVTDQPNANPTPSVSPSQTLSSTTTATPVITGTATTTPVFSATSTPTRTISPTATISTTRTPTPTPTGTPVFTLIEEQRICKVLNSFAFGAWFYQKLCQ